MKCRSLFRRASLVIVLCVIAGMLLVFAHAARAEYPHYLFLQPSYGGYGQAGPVQSYAYGWFGVCPRQTWTWHWDYYGSRWIWR